MNGEEANPQAMLKIYVDLSNSERQAIWARTAAMLVANSFIINVIRIDPTKSETCVNLLFSLAGILICAAWTLMTWEGWNVFERYAQDAKALKIPSNPLASHLDPRSKDWIFLSIMSVICIFAFMYLVLFVRVLAQ